MEELKFSSLQFVEKLPMLKLMGLMKLRYGVMVNKQEVLCL